MVPPDNKQPTEKRRVMTYVRLDESLDADQPHIHLNSFSHISHFCVVHLLFESRTRVINEWRRPAHCHRRLRKQCDSSFSVFLQMTFRSLISVPCVSCWQLMNGYAQNCVELRAFVRYHLLHIVSFFCAHNRTHMNIEREVDASCAFFLLVISVRSLAIERGEYSNLNLIFYSLSSSAFWYVWICGVKATARDRRF